MGEDINIEQIECYKDCYQVDIRYTESGKGERIFIRRDALFALITVAEKNYFDKVNGLPQQGQV